MLWLLIPAGLVAVTVAGSYALRWEQEDACRRRHIREVAILSQPGGADALRLIAAHATVWPPTPTQERPRRVSRPR
jgi:hypothetical protein